MMIKKVFPWIVFISFFILLIIGFSSKDEMNKYAANLMQKQASAATIHSGRNIIDSLYNYTKSDLEYKITFLEFGATGCSACKRMESVMHSIKTNYPNHIHVVFRNVSIKENLELMKYYGIASIPTQIFLNKKGEEIFRHTGYISADDIEINVLKQMI